MNRILRISIVVVICLILILGVALLLGQCSKKNAEETTAAPDVSTTQPTTQPSTTQPSTTPTTPPDPVCTEHVDGDTDYFCDICGEELERPAPDPVFTETNDKIYVITTELNVRSSPEVPENEKDFYKNVVGSVFTDAELERVGYYDNGWSEIIYNGERCFVKTSKVTTQKPITEFTSVEETVYLTKTAHVYTRPSHLAAENYSEYVNLAAGTCVTKLGEATELYLSDDGKEYKFAKIQYTIEGQDEPVIRYINNEYLTTDVPTSSNPDGSVVFEEDSSILVVVAPQSIALRKSTIYVDSEIDGYAVTGQELQATHRGVESDGTIWYKVVVEDVTHYVIFNANLQIKTPTAQ